MGRRQTAGPDLPGALCKPDRQPGCTEKNAALEQGSERRERGSEGLSPVWGVQPVSILNKLVHSMPVAVVGRIENPFVKADEQSEACSIRPDHSSRSARKPRTSLIPRSTTARSSGTQ